MPKESPRPEVMLQVSRRTHSGIPVCNNNCPVCYLFDSRTFGEEFLDLKGWKKVVDVLPVSVSPAVDVSYGGAEATLFPELPELIRYTKETITNTTTLLFTNGRRMGKNPEYVRILKGNGLDGTQISVNSHHPETHNLTQGMKINVHAETVRGIENALTQGLFVSANIVLQPANAAEIVDTVAWVHDLGVNDITVSKFQPVGRGLRFAQTLPQDFESVVVPDTVQKLEDLQRSRGWKNHLLLNGFDGYKSSHRITVGPDGVVSADDVLWKPIEN